MQILFLFFLLLLQTPPAAQAPAQAALPGAETPKATLRGHVYALDTGGPLKRASLSLHKDNSREPVNTSTDVQGAFEFRNVEPGTYTLFCNKTRFVPATYGQKAPNQPPVRLTVREGQEMKDLDFRLVRGGVISGTVVDEDGEPLSRVQVQAMVRQYRRGQSQVAPRGSAQTDDRGQYRIFDLPAGRYYVQASLRSFGDQESSYAPVYYPNALTFRDSQRIEVGRGAEVSRVDFRLTPVPTYTVSGKVFDLQTGRPLTEGVVNVMAAEMQGGAFGGSQIRSDGSFLLRGLAPGKYNLMIMTPQRPGQFSGRVVKPFELGSANLENLMVTVGPGVSVRGRLVAEGGTLNNAGLRVSLSPKAEAMFFFGASGLVNIDLSFEITGVQPGEYEARVASPSGFSSTGGSGQSFYVREVRVGDKSSSEGAFTVAEGAPVGDLEVVLDFQGGAVSGRVLNEAGEPATGVQVALVSADPQKRATERYFRSAAPDQNGNYALKGVIPGNYLLLVWPEADVFQILDPDLFQQLERHAVRVSVEKSATVNRDVRLTPEIKTIAQNFAM